MCSAAGLPSGRGPPSRVYTHCPRGITPSSTNTGLTIRPYWQLQFPDAAESAECAERPFESWLEELNHLLYDATRIRLRADVPVGAYLSGGLDSTFTSALVKRHFNNRLCTFSVGFSDARFDESAYQREAVAALGTEHRECRCTESDIGEIFPRVVWHTETPILRTAPAPLFLLSRLVRSADYKVVLTGEGADEIFAGYNIFKEDRVRRFWARQPDSALRPQLIAKLYPYIFGDQKAQSQSFVQGFFKRHLSRTDSPVYSHLLRWENTGHLKGFLSRDINAACGGAEEFVERYTALLPPEHRTLAPAVAGPVHRDPALSLQLSLVLPGGPHGHGPLGGGPLPFPGLPGGRAGRPHAAALPPERADGKVYSKKSRGGAGAAADRR